MREFEGVGDRVGRISPDGFERPVLPPPRALPFQSGGIPMLPGVSRTVRLTDSLPYLEIYPHLELDDAMPLLRAARAYERALWIADGEPQTSWLLLIGAVAGRRPGGQDRNSAARPRTDRPANRDRRSG